MSTLQQFVTSASVLACSGSEEDRSKAIAALDAYVATFSKQDQRSALLSAHTGMRSVRLSGSVWEHVTGPFT